MDKDMWIDMGISFVLSALRSIKGQKGEKLKAAKAKAKPWVLKIVNTAKQIYSDDPDFQSEG